ncbi:MAG TPA: DUF192 domain-containing protein [Holophaga sp.]|nr:DUF192 domain-containing protein [Holophaga sp.]
MSAFFLSLLLALSPGTPDGGTVAIKGQRFLAEVARTPQEQARGLMYRQSLAKDRCMIFLYGQDGRHAIWMKNCLISLDVIWVKADGIVAEMAQNVPPLSPMWKGPDEEIPNYGGQVDTRHFVELPAGTIKRLGLKVGDRIGWDLHLADGSVMKGGCAVPADPLAKQARKKKR